VRRGPVGVSGGKEQGTHRVGNGPWLQFYPTSSECVRRLGYPEAGPQNQGDRQVGESHFRAERRAHRRIPVLKGRSVNG
jgi:hypothetical protein